MSFLVSLLLFLGVIGSEADYDATQESYYESTYATEENVDAYYRQNDPSDEDGW
ncbi:hypothetical protein HZR84_12815 [Hyphobacterium sp. CCMP332]|nr:hypothetical protein HZR84_12815 [Hyphobacterium sp. CCMP332]